MRPILIVSGVLGGGSALVFVVAGLVAMLFPNGTLVGGSWNGCFDCGGKGVAVPVPMPVPVGPDGATQNGVVLQVDGTPVFGPSGTDGDLLPQP
jgi:hypothetical protein